MAIELTPGAFEAAGPLFRAPYQEFVFDALVVGNAPGRLWVDDPSNPLSAFLWDTGPRFYFAGSEDDRAFNESVKQIAQQAAPPTGAYMVVYCDSPHWEGKLSDIFGGRPLHRAQRCMYKLGSPWIPDWRDRLPRGFSVSRIDRRLLSGSDNANLDQMVAEIQSTWPSVDRFLGSGFGYCALHGDGTIVCWCTGEYASGNHLGVGIETIAGYRKRGLATLTASAFAEHCVSMGIEAHWDCWANNLPSVRVAEKVGFRKILDYEVYEG